MRVDDQHGAWLAKLAAAGHRRALEQLVELYLPLVYNILGLGLSGSPVTEDDVGRLALRTTIRVARGSGARPDRTRMRAWFAEAAVDQVRRERLAAHDGGDGSGSSRRERLAASDGPGIDFVDVAIARLGLSGEPQELLLATRWLDAE